MDIANTIKAIIILSIDGKRTLAKYYDEKLNQPSFEKNIFARTHRTKDEVLVVDGATVVHKSITDLHFYVVGSANENPVILATVLKCLDEVVSSLLNKNVERQALMDKLDDMILALDEICDGGVIIETDPNLVLERVWLKEDAAEPSMAQVFQTAKEFSFFSFRS